MYGNDAAPEPLFEEDFGAFYGREFRRVIARVTPGAVQDLILVRHVDNSYAELVKAATDVMDARRLDPGLKGIHLVAVDEVHSRLTVEVTPGTDVVLVQERAEELVDLPVVVKVEEVSTPAVCVNVSDCHSPLWAGVKVRNSAGGGLSSLNFGISVSGDKQVLMAGHATEATLPGWYHPGSGFIGLEGESLYYDGGRDAKAILAPDSEVGKKIYTDYPDYPYYSPPAYRWVTGKANASVGLLICNSGINGVYCGLVTESWIEYDLGEIQDLIGARGNYESVSGNSGGPVYHPTVAGEGQAVGVNSTTGGAFAHIGKVLDDLGATLLKVAGS